MLSEKIGLKKVNSNLRDLSKMLSFGHTFPFVLKMHIFDHQTFSNRNFRTLIADFSIFTKNITGGAVIRYRHFRVTVPYRQTLSVS